MKQLFLSLAVFGLITATTGAAHAACFAEYKAKQENPLRLHYGVVQVDAEPCTMSKDVRDTVKERVAAGGWTVLQVGSVFGDDGLAGRKKDAGDYFLRF